MSELDCECAKHFLNRREQSEQRQDISASSVLSCSIQFVAASSLKSSRQHNDFNLVNDDLTFRGGCAFGQRDVQLVVSSG